jgi:hypothetical protein
VKTYRGERIAAYLRAHPEVWQDYDGSAEARKYLFEVLQREGLFSPRTSYFDVNFRAIELVRLGEMMEGER